MNASAARRRAAAADISVPNPVKLTGFGTLNRHRKKSANAARYFIPKRFSFLNTKRIMIGPDATVAENKAARPAASRPPWLQPSLAACQCRLRHWCQAASPGPAGVHVQPAQVQRAAAAPGRTQISNRFAVILNRKINKIQHISALLAAAAAINTSSQPTSNNSPTTGEVIIDCNTSDMHHGDQENFDKSLSTN